jgi:hypothetical protein
VSTIAGEAFAFANDRPRRKTGPPTERPRRLAVSGEPLFPRAGSCLVTPPHSPPQRPGLSDLAQEKCQELDERAKRERLARKHINDGLFDALRQGGGLAAAVGAITDALQAYGYPCGAIGGHMIERGYLTMVHVSELLRGDPKWPPDIFGL